LIGGIPPVVKYLWLWLPENKNSESILRRQSKMMEKRRRSVSSSGLWNVVNKLYNCAINLVINPKSVYKSRTPQIRDVIYFLW
jgi:hypothetical protein